MVWKLGGTDPGSASDAEYLELVDDDAGEFCGQHTPTLTERGTVVLFDNGVHCIGQRKTLPAFTRVVEYDISSDIEAVLINQYRLPDGYGYSQYLGSVEELDNGRWLISWGALRDVSVEPSRTIAVSEVDPADGRAFLHLSMSKDDERVATYRVHRAPEFEIPLNLP